MRNNDDYIPENEQQNTNQTTEQQDTTNSTPEENGGNGERLFTQEEVNRIIAERLARERAKSGPSEEERKAPELARQELRLQMKQRLFDAGFHVDAIFDFFDHIDLSTIEGFEQTMHRLDDLLNEYYRKAERLKQYQATNAGAGTLRNAQMDDALKEIFRLGGQIS